jgi:Protein of unknown function (DUF3619)
MNTDNFQENEIDTQNIDRQAKQIAGLLDAHANRLSMRTLKQLENGRERAVKAHAQQISGVSVNRDGTLSSISSWVEHHRMAMAGFALAVIVAGFMAAQSFKHQESSDAYLLSADLPPEAFVDRGFEPSLNDAHAKL